jgi:3-(3-hydroxy-phenyl)propionate hydroxylase
VTKAAKMLGTIIGELDPEKARARDRKLLADQGGSVKPKLRQAFIPGIFDGLLLKESSGNGKVFPQPFAKTGPNSLIRLDELTGGKSVLVLKETPENSATWNVWATLARSVDLSLSTISRSWVGQIDGVLFIQETESILSNWFDAHECVAALVRPDHYVYGTTAKIAGVSDLIQKYARALACE